MLDNQDKSMADDACSCMDDKCPKHYGHASCVNPVEMILSWHGHRVGVCEACLDAHTETITAQ